jgi:elongation factor 1-gamma
MAFGTLFTTENNPRTTAIKAVAKANNLELNIVEADTASPSIEHTKASPLGKIPAFLGEDGFALSECLAVAIYRESLFPLSCHKCFPAARPFIGPALLL